MAWGGDRRSPNWREQAKKAKPAKARPQLRAETKVTKVPAEASTIPAIDRAAWAQMLPEIVALSEKYSSKVSRSAENNPFRLPTDFPKPLMEALAKQNLPTMAMDDGLTGNLAVSAAGWISGPALDALPGEGLLFLGYTYLADLAQRPEYRVMSETIADDATREWIDFDVVGDEKEQAEAAAKDPEGHEERMADPDERKKRVDQAGKTDKVKALQDDQLRLEVRDRFYEQCRNDGFFGRTHLFLDIRAPGTDEISPDELKAEIGDSRDATSKTKCQKGWFQAMRTVEPVWTYPLMYNAINPLRKDWYNPQVWFVMGQEIHGTRLQTFVGHPVPDMLKPAYSFGGLSLTQMAKPYVDIWLTTRQSVAQLIHSFSVMVLATDMQSTLAPNNATNLLARVLMFNAFRDNQNAYVINKNTEEFKNVSAPLSGLHELQAQAQEHMACLGAGTLIETDRGAVPIEEVTLEDQVLTRTGFAPIKWIGVTGHADTFIEIEAGGSVLRSTEEHPIWSESSREFVDARNVSRSHRLLKSTSAENTARRSFGAAVGGGTQRPTITGIKRLAASFMSSCGNLIAGLFPTATNFITATRTAPTTIGIISKCSPTWSISDVISGFIRSSSSRFARFAETSLFALSSGPDFAPAHAKPERATSAMDGSRLHTRGHANAAARFSQPNDPKPDFAAGLACSVPVSRVSEIKVPLQPVYNIEVSDGFLPEFFANGILVHNSVHRIPLVKFTGIQPSGLNASSEGEIEVYDDTISAYQSRFLDPNLRRVINFEQLSLFGEIDPEITHRWNKLRPETQAELGQRLKDEADTMQKYVDMGSFGPDEVRKVAIENKDLPFTGLKAEDMPEPPAEEGLLEPGAGGAAKEFEAEHAPGGGKGPEGAENPK